MGSSGPQSHSEQRKQLEPRLKREELEAQYNFDVFNRQVVGAGLWRSRSQEAVMDCDASAPQHDMELRLAKCVQVLGQLEVGLREVRQCAEEAPDFRRLHQMLHQQEQVIAQTLQEVRSDAESRLVQQMAHYEVLAAEQPLLEEQVNQLASVAEELTDALEDAKSIEAQLSSDLALTQQQLAEAVARVSQLEDNGGSALQETVAQQAAELEAERAHVRELQLRVARVEVEWNLEQALKKKGRSYNFRHFDI
ncbi:unnamed protein product [Durusdinium trenchii]|uniref:Uncharacterized protein n=1 Tax=Durusdinium trenchii TaxID=1381693 RepID=A0ABP0J4Q0_9DINO